MTREDLEPKEDDNFDCLLQVVDMGGLLCRGAQQKSGQTTNKVNAKICFNCDIGKIYRDVGCENVSGRTIIHELRTMGSSPYLQHSLEAIFCNINKRNTALDLCKKCELITAETTKEIVSKTKGLFEAHGFYMAYKQIEEARKEIRDGKFKHVITLSINFLESTMRICHDKLGISLPDNKSLEALWDSTNKNLQFEKIAAFKTTDHLNNKLFAVFTKLGEIRNNLGDAHSKGEIPTSVDYMIAELALNISSTLSTAIVRRFNQIKGKNENE